MLSLFQWLQASWLGTTVNESTWAFAVIEAGHLLALAAIGGAVLIVDVRLMGWGLLEQRIDEVGRAARPYLVWSLVTMIATGVPLLASLAAEKYYVNETFWLKMYFLLAAMLYTFTVRRAVVMGSAERANSLVGKVAAIVSVILWSGVGLMGRGIGFY